MALASQTGLKPVERLQLHQQLLQSKPTLKSATEAALAHDVLIPALVKEAEEVKAFSELSEQPELSAELKAHLPKVTVSKQLNRLHNQLFVQTGRSRQHWTKAALLAVLSNSKNGWQNRAESEIRSTVQYLLKYLAFLSVNHLINNSNVLMWAVVEWFKQMHTANATSLNEWVILAKTVAQTLRQDVGQSPDAYLAKRTIEGLILATLNSWLI